MNNKPYSYRDDTQVQSFLDDKPVIVFDGYCVLCSGWVNFVLKHDKRKVYRLLAAQSPLGQALYVHYGLGSAGTDDYQSNLLIHSGLVFIRSEGTIQMAEGLGWPWRIAGVMRVLPLAWRDRLYDWVARNRLHWFGKRQACYLPAPTDADRFISSEPL
jgi:predicted DCC family thiol-disulfide oxidoreductase YuxK